MYDKIHYNKNNIIIIIIIIIKEKYSKPIKVQYYPAGCLSWVPRLTLLDLTNKLDWTGMHSRNRTRLYVGELLEMERNIVLSTQDSLNPGFKLFTPSPLSVFTWPHPSSLGPLKFSRQEHWSGLPFPSPIRDSEKWKWSHSVVSDS